MRVPTSNEFSVGVANAPSANFAAPNLPDVGVEVTRAGNQAFSAGQEVVNAQMKMLAEMNELATDNALAQVKAFEQDLRVNPNNGYENLRGENALNRPNGQSLVDEYDGYLMEHGIRQTLRNKTGEHLLAEGRKWKDTSLNTQIELAANSFSLSTTDEERDAAIERAISAAKGLQDLYGWDSETMQKKVMDASDKAISQVIDDKIDKGDYAEARRLAIQYGAFAHGETVVKARQKIEQAYQDQIIEDATANFKPGDTIRIPVNINSAQAQTGNPVQDTVSRIIGYESGNDPNIKNKKSTAEGLGQFIDSTWFYMVRKYRPDIANGKTNAQLKALKRDPALSREMTTRYVEENAALLKKHGFPVNVRNLYVMHFLGSGEGPKLLRADPNQPVSSFISAQSINANKTVLSGKTAQQVLDWAARAMKVGKDSGGGTSYVSIPTGDPVAMEKAIRQLPKNQQASVRANINRQISAYNEADKQRKAENTNAIMGMLENGGSVNSIPKSVWSGLTTQEREKFRAYEAAVKNRNEKQLFEANTDNYLQMTNPDVLRKMTREQVAATAVVFGRPATVTLLNKWDSIQKQGESEIKAQTVQNEYFQHILKENFNIDLRGKHTEKEKQLAANIKFNFNQALANKQKEMGRKLTEDEQQQLMRYWAGVTYTEKGWFFDKERSVMEDNPYGEHAGKFF